LRVLGLGFGWVTVWVFGRGCLDFGLEAKVYTLPWFVWEDRFGRGQVWERTGFHRERTNAEVYDLDK
jgi:hypothetical protein